MNSVQTVYVPVVLFMPLQEQQSKLECIQSEEASNILKNVTNKNVIGSEISNKVKSRDIKHRFEPYANNIPKVNNHSFKDSNKRAKRRNYYQSDFITNPCDQLFGPQQLDSTTLSEKTDTDLELSRNEKVDENRTFSKDIAHSCVSSVSKTDGYIPTPRWNRTQNMVLEELYKKSRFPKSSEIKVLAQRLHVMDSDVEEWFRKRRGRDRKIKKKNENLKSLIDNYLHH